MKFLPLILSGLWFAPVLGRGQSDLDAPAPRPPRREIAVELMVVELPAKAAMAIINQLKKPAMQSQAVDRLETAIGTGEAKLISWPGFQILEGQHGVAEDLQEWRYADVYQSFAPMVRYGYSGYSSTPERTEEQKQAEKEYLAKESARIGATDFGSVPLLQTRDLGVTLDADSESLPNGDIKVLARAKHSRLSRLRPSVLKPDEPMPGARLEQIVAGQPDVQECKAEAEFVLRDREIRLLGSFATKAPAGNIELFVLRAELIPGK